MNEKERTERLESLPEQLVHYFHNDVSVRNIWNAYAIGYIPSKEDAYIAIIKDLALRNRNLHDESYRRFSLMLEPRIIIDAKKEVKP